MLKKSQTNIKALLVLSLGLLVSCGGPAGSKSSSLPPRVLDTPSPPNSGPSEPVKIAAQFIDSPVNGLDYVRADGTLGKTGAGGSFECLQGEIIQFKVAEKLHLGKAICNDKIFIEQLDVSSPTITPGLVALLLKINKSTDASIEIDLNGISAALNNISLPDLISLNNGGNASALTSINGALNSIKVGSGDFTQNSFNNAKVLAGAHIQESIGANSEIKASDATIAGTLTNWLEVNTKTPKVTNLDSQVVYQTVGTGLNPNACPAGDLAGVEMVLSADNSSPKNYFFGSQLNLTGVNPSPISKTKILSRRTTSFFDLNFGSDSMSGSISISVNPDLKGVKGLVQFDVRDTSRTLKAHCEYIISI